MSKIKQVIERMRRGEDLGLDRSAGQGRQRSINLDGSYNVERKTGRLFGNFFLYHWLITTSWKNYWFALLSYYVVMNIAFATIYFLIGIDQLSGVNYTGHLTSGFIVSFSQPNHSQLLGMEEFIPLVKWLISLPSQRLL